MDCIQTVPKEAVGSGFIVFASMMKVTWNVFETRLAIDRSICILTRPVVITGFNRLLLVDWWSIGRLKKLGSCENTWHYLSPVLLNSIKTKSSLI